MILKSCLRVVFIVPGVTDTSDRDMFGARCLSGNLTDAESSLTSVAKVGRVHFCLLLFAPTCLMAAKREREKLREEGW